MPRKLNLINIETALLLSIEYVQDNYPVDEIESFRIAEQIAAEYLGLV